MVQYKLTYFNCRGRGEVLRLMFAYTDTPYEDIRIEDDQWENLKPNTIFGQLPQLEVDGIALAQSHAIGRYVARQLKMAGKTPLDEARCDMIVDFMEDFIIPLVTIYEAPDEKKEELKEKFMEERAPLLGKLEKILVANGGGDGFMVGDSLTWADLSFLNGTELPEDVDLQLDWDAIPKLKALKERIKAIPKIKSWIEKRPKTPF